MWISKVTAASLLVALFGVMSSEARKTCHVTVHVDSNGCSIGDNGGGTTDMTIQVAIYDGTRLHYQNEQMRFNRATEKNKKCFDGDNWCYQFWYTSGQTGAMNFYVNGGAYGAFLQEPQVNHWNNGGCWGRYNAYVYPPFPC